MLGWLVTPKRVRRCILDSAYIGWRKRKEYSIEYRAYLNRVYTLKKKENDEIRCLNVHECRCRYGRHGSLVRKKRMAAAVKPSAAKARNMPV